MKIQVHVSGNSHSFERKAAFANKSSRKRRRLARRDRVHKSRHCQTLYDSLIFQSRSSIMSCTSVQIASRGNVGLPNGRRLTLTAESMVPVKSHFCQESPIVPPCHFLRASKFSVASPSLLAKSRITYHCENCQCVYASHSDYRWCGCERMLDVAASSYP